MEEGEGIEAVIRALEFDVLQLGLINNNKSLALTKTYHMYISDRSSRERKRERERKIKTNTIKQSSSSKKHISKIYFTFNSMFFCEV